MRSSDRDAAGARFYAPGLGAFINVPVSVLWRRFLRASGVTGGVPPSWESTCRSRPSLTRKHRDRVRPGIGAIREDPDGVGTRGLEHMPPDVAAGSRGTDERTVGPEQVPQQRVSGARGLSLEIDDLAGGCGELRTLARRAITRYPCPACEQLVLDQPAWTDQGSASDEICPSCGIQSGYHDAAPDSRELVYGGGGRSGCAMGVVGKSGRSSPGWDQGTGHG